MDQHSPNSKFEVKELKITYDPIETKWTKMTPKSLRKKITQIQEYTKTDPKKAINEIAKIYLRHRELPVLNNYLCLSYEAIGNLESVERLQLEITRHFQDIYLQKQITLPFAYIKENLIKSKKYLNIKSDLQSLYPEREVFSFHRVSCFPEYLGHILL